MPRNLNDRHHMGKRLRRKLEDTSIRHFLQSAMMEKVKEDIDKTRRRLRFLIAKKKEIAALGKKRLIGASIESIPKGGLQNAKSSR